MAADKVRIRFRKDGDLRLVSHHDLMRAMERLLRRAEIPFHSTGGFHPTPRMIFALSLPLGVIGRNEVVEIELTEVVEPEEVLARLSRKAPPGITFLNARRISPRVTARARRAVYQLALGISVPNAVLERCQTILGSDFLWVERLRPKPKRVNIRPYIDDLKFQDATLEMILWITPEGTARAEEIVRALGLSERLETGAVLERTFLELADEVDPEEARRLPRTIPSVVEPDESDVVADDAEIKIPAPSAHWGASPSGPIVE